MVLPLLGLLGAAAGTLAAPSINNFMAKGRGRAFDQSGVDMSSFGEAGVQAQRMGSAGILGGYGSEGNRQLVDQMFGVQEGRADRGNALQRANISAASGIMNANLARDKFNNQLEAQANYGSALVRAGMPEMWAGTPLQDHYATQMGVNSPEFMDAGKTDQTIAKEAYTSELQYQAENAQLREVIDAPQIRQQQALQAQEAEFMTTAQPTLDVIEKYDRAQTLLQDTSVWGAGEESRVGRAEYRQTMNELRAEWLNREITQGREPSDSLREEAEKLFPVEFPKTSLERNRISEFIKLEMGQARDRVNRTGSRIFGGMDAWQQSYQRGSGQAPDGSNVIPTGGR